MLAQRLSLVPTFMLPATASYCDRRTLTHGWRWYRVEDGKLRSPLHGYPLELPPDGQLPGCYFVPRAANIWPIVLMLRDKRWYDFALTFGTVSGPFMRDPQMPRIGSMQATEYQAQVIATDSTADLSTYALPVMPALDLATLQRLEKGVSALSVSDTVQ